MRLIDAEDFRKGMYHEAFETDSDLQKWDSGCWIRWKMLENHLQKAPTVDAAPVVHGEWIGEYGEHVPLTNGIPDDSCSCSICGKWLVASDEYGPYGYYCPNCGAKMDAKED